VALREVDRFERFAERADLIDLHEDRVGAAFIDAALKELRVGDEQIIADELHLVRPTAA
jgi:hypothetical protein